MTLPLYVEAVRRFIESDTSGWSSLAFFSSGAAERVAAQVDAATDPATAVWPYPGKVFVALSATFRGSVQVVILGQDPYPTPGIATGLAFDAAPSYKMPASLRNIHRELQSDIGCSLGLGISALDRGLMAWAEQGVLLLNTCLTVRSGRPGSHRGFGWERLAHEIIEDVSGGSQPTVFILWGGDAQKQRRLIDEKRHLVIASPHPSPLSAYRGFFGSRPFSRTNDWLRERNRSGIEWCRNFAIDRNRLP